MPDCPPEILAAAADPIAEMFPGLGLPTARKIAAVALDAAAPLLADAVAGKLLAHMEIHGPRDQGTRKRTWRRHFRAAAQVASLAFTTEDEQKRQAWQALAREHSAACPAPEGEQ